MLGDFLARAGAFARWVAEFITTMPEQTLGAWVAGGVAAVALVIVLVVWAPLRRSRVGWIAVLALLSLLLAGLAAATFQDGPLSAFGALLQGVFSVLAFFGVVVGFRYQNRQMELQGEQIRLQTLQLTQANLINLHDQFERGWERIGRRLVEQIGARSDATVDPFEVLLLTENSSKLHACLSIEKDEIVIDLVRRFVQKFEAFREALSRFDDGALLEGALLDSKEEKIFYTKFKGLV